MYLCLLLFDMWYSRMPRHLLQPPPADQALKDRGGLEFAGWNAAPVDSPHESAS